MDRREVLKALAAGALAAAAPHLAQADASPWLDAGNGLQFRSILLTGEELAAVYPAQDTPLWLLHYRKPGQPAFYKRLTETNFMDYEPEIRQFYHDDALYVARRDHPDSAFPPIEAKAAKT